MPHHRSFAYCFLLSGLALLLPVPLAAAQDSPLATTLGISFPADSSTEAILERDGHRYAIDVKRRTVTEIAALAGTRGEDNNAASKLFAANCAGCHGPDGRGIPGLGTPDFTDPRTQSAMTGAGIQDSIRNGRANGRMPAWSGKLSDAQIAELAAYVQGLQSGTSAQAQAAGPGKVAGKTPGVYDPGDDSLFTLPSGRATDRHGVYVNFTHRFPFDPAFTGTGRGAQLFGLDGFALPSLGFRYGVTDRLAVSVLRSPAIIGRPIQLMAAYNVLDEHRGSPINFTARVSIEGQDNFTKNFAESVEGILSRSVSGRAQIYAVPTVSFNARPLSQGGFGSPIRNEPGVNTFSIGFGAAFDVRPTVALLVEVIPTLANGSDLGIHRPPYSFAIQKKIWRHAFTLGFTTAPATTVSQRSATRAEFLKDPSADKPGGLFIGFDLTRQIK